MNESDALRFIPLDVDMSAECGVCCLLIYYTALIVFFVSLPFHFCYLASIVKFNEEAYCKGPFFTLAFSLGIADIGQSFVTWIFSRMLDNLMYMPALVSISWFFLCSQVFGVLWISLNRFSAVAHPEKHASVWRRRRVFKMIAVQWVLAFVITLPNNFIELSSHLQSTSIVGKWVPEIDPKELAQVYYGMGNLLFFMIITVIFLPVLFIFMGFKVWQHKSTDHSCCEYNNYECSMDPHEFRLAAVATVYMLMLALTYIAEFAFVLYDTNRIALYVTYSIVFDLFNVSKPFVCLALSAPARHYFVRFIRCQPAISTNRRHSRVAPQRFREEVISRF